MTLRQNMWLIRIASIPALLFLPFACTLIAGCVFGWPEGDNFPTAVFFGFIAALVLAFPLSRRTTFARLEQFTKAKRVLIGLTAFDVLAIPLTRIFVL